MPRRCGVVELGRLRGRDAVMAVARELRAARQDRGLTQETIAAELRVDRSYISLIERGLVDNLSIVLASELLAAVGLDLAVRTYPSAGPLRDAAQRALIARLRTRVHPDLEWATEVPLPVAGDLRAWDVVISGRGWRCGIEAETRPRDLQALERRIALKQRDGEVEFVVLLLAGTRHNRALLREHGVDLRARFPVPGARAVELLGAGRSPGGNAIALL